MREASSVGPGLDSESLASGSGRPWLGHYPEGVRSSLEYPDIPLHRFVDDSAALYPDRAATIFFGGKISYRDLARKVNQFGNALKALGVKKGDRVAVMLPNCPQAVISLFAALKIGAIGVMTNPLYVERELEHQLNDSGAETLIVLDLLWGRVLNVRDHTPLKRVIVTSIKDFLPFPLNLLYPLKQKPKVPVTPGPGVHLFSELLRGQSAVLEEEPLEPASDIALLQYTGGTTGISKGAILTHRNLVANVLQVKECLVGCQSGEERVLGVLPFFHVYGLTVCLNFSVALGATLIVVPKFEVEDVLKLINRHKPTLFPGAPTMYIGVINHPEVKKYDLSSITACISGSAPLPQEVQIRFEELTGGKLVEGYGLTEASPVTHCNPVFGRRKLGSIGLPVSDTDVRIVDLETGELDVPFGDAGELCIRGPQVMAGYWNRPDETSRTLINGWLHTGDIARMDEEGYAYIIDRKKDMIIAGGYNIYPREVEEVLYEHSKVREAAVAGIPDPYRGETVKAYLVLKEGQQATAEEIIQFCRGRMAKYKVPTHVEFRDALPKTLVGKVLRRRLVEEEKQKTPVAEAGDAGGSEGGNAAGAEGGNGDGPEAPGLP